MHKISKALALYSVLLVLVLSACTSVNVRKIDSGLYPVNHVCIEENPKVNVDDIISVVEDRLMDHGITSEVVSKGNTTHCNYLLTYTARRSWDIVHYLGFAEIKIRQKHKIIGSATYRHRGGSLSLSLNKWASTKSKIDPIIDELLSDFIAK